MIDDHGRRMTDRMTSSERDQSFPDSEPRDAATIMLIDRAGVTPKVLLGRRHAGHKFMPGKFVFPGGRIEALDRTMSAVSELHPDTQAKWLVRVPAAELSRRLRGTVLERAGATLLKRNAAAVLLCGRHADPARARALAEELAASSNSPVVQATLQACLAASAGIQ